MAFLKIKPDHIDKIISAEIPDKETDPNLYEIITKNMVHFPCSLHNINSPCMIDGKCTKRYPKTYTNETITGHDDSYPLYHQRFPDNGGKLLTLVVRNQCIKQLIIGVLLRIHHCCQEHIKYI